MPLWITALLTGGGKLIGALADWWAGRQAAQHDNDVKTQQQTTDALQGESNALEQVDRDAAAVDAAGRVPIASDPNNRNR